MCYRVDVLRDLLSILEWSVRCTEEVQLAAASQSKAGDLHPLLAAHQSATARLIAELKQG